MQILFRTLVTDFIQVNVNFKMVNLNVGLSLKSQINIDYHITVALVDRFLKFK